MNDPLAERDTPKRDHQASASPSPDESVSGDASSEGPATEGPVTDKSKPSKQRHSTKQRATDWAQESSLPPEETARFEEARKREEQFRVLKEEATEYAIALLGPDGYVESWNRGARRLTDYSKQEAVGRPLSIFFPPEEVEAGLPERALEAASRAGSWSQAGWKVRKDGSRFWAQGTIRVIAREKDYPQGFAFVLRDLSRRQRLKRETLQVQKQEWERLKEELHDIAGSQLTGANLLLNMACQEATGEELAQLQKIKALIAESSQTLQKISRRLTPNGLSKGGLPEALARLAEDTEGGRFEGGDEPIKLQNEEAKQLYWIAREAIASARRQNENPEIVLRLTEETGALVLLIKAESGSLEASESDTSDFDASEDNTSETEGPPVALRSMRRRADLLGAVLKAESAPAGGTRIRCRLPR